MLEQLIKSSYIKQENNRFTIYSKNGKILGKFDTFKEAKSRLEQISVKNIKKASEYMPLTFSATMRFLNKNYKDKVLTFLKIFKEAFDTALLQDLEDKESLALLEAIKKSDIDIEELYAEIS